jgi:hypothetical protein
VPADLKPAPIGVVLPLANLLNPLGLGVCCGLRDGPLGGFPSPLAGPPRAITFVGNDSGCVSPVGDRQRAKSGVSALSYSEVSESAPVRAAASAASRARALRIAGVATVPRTAASMVAASMARLGVLGGSFFVAAGFGGVGFCKRPPLLVSTWLANQLERLCVRDSGAKRATRDLAPQSSLKATKLESPEFCAKNRARFHRVLHRSHNAVGSVVLPRLSVLFCCIQKSAQISSYCGSYRAAAARLLLFGPRVHLLWCSRRPVCPGPTRGGNPTFVAPAAI